MWIIGLNCYLSFYRNNQYVSQLNCYTVDDVLHCYTNYHLHLTGNKCMMECTVNWQVFCTA